MNILCKDGKTNFKLPISKKENKCLPGTVTISVPLGFNILY